MAQDTIDKIINIQLKYSELLDGWKKTTQAIEENKKIMNELRNEYKAGQMTSDEYRESQAELKNIETALKGELRQYNKEIQNNIKIETKAAGSVDQLRANVSKLTAQYNALSAPEREGKFGQRLAANIKSQQEALNQAEMSLGNYRSQVGNYENAIKNALPFGNSMIMQLAQTAQNAGGATGMIKNAGVALGGLVKTAVAFIATPLGAMLAALYAAYKSVSFVISEVNDRLQGNERLYFKNKEAMTMVEAMNAAYTRSVDAQAESVVKLTAKLKTLANGFWIFIKNLAKGGIVGGIVDTWNQMTDATNIKQTYNELAKKEEEYTNNRRKFKKQEAELEVQISELRNKASDKTTYSDKERVEFLKQAKTSTQELYKGRRKLLEQEIEIAKLEASTTENSIETNDKLADLEARLIRLNAQEQDALRMLNRPLSSAMSSALNDLTETEKIAKQNAKIIADAEAQALKITQQMREKTRDNELLTLKENYNKETGLLQDKIDNDANLSKEAKAALSRQLLVMEEQYQQQRQGIIDKWSQKELDKQVKAKEEEYKNRLLAAKLQATKAGDSPEQQLAAAKQVAMAEVEIAAQKLRDISSMENATQAQKLQAEIELQEAIRRTGEVDKQVAAQRLQDTRQILSSASSTVGAFSQMFDALGSEGEEFAEFSKALAVFQIAISTAEAIAGAVAAGSKATSWITIAATIAGSIAAVVAAMAQADSKVESAKLPSYADGGLITGPGTGTSDSITARVSNGEAVMTAAVVADWGAVLSAINVSSGGNAIDTSHLPSRSSGGMEQMEEMMERVMLKMPRPVVSVADINRGQNRVKVSEGLGRLSGRKNKK